MRYFCYDAGFCVEKVHLVCALKSHLQMLCGFFIVYFFRGVTEAVPVSPLVS